MTHRLLALLLLSLLLAGPVQAQAVPTIGTAGTLEVATWNIEWFGSTSNGPNNEAQQLANAAAVIEQSGIDLWALQEIADPGAFDDLLDALGSEYTGHLASQPSYSGAQRVAFVYRTAAITPRNVRHVLENYQYAFASRPPLHMEAEVTLPDTTLVINFITLHAKCCSGSSEHERREEASTRLKNHIDFTALRSEPTVVLGDFNDELTGAITSGRSSPYTNFVEDTDDYLFATLEMEQRNEATYCGNSTTCSGSSTIDHILLTDELFEPFAEGSTSRMNALLALDDNRYVYTTSDHLPVYAVFDFTTGTAIEDERPRALVVQRPFPNPFREAATLRYALDRPAAVQVDLYDALGRHVRSLHDALAAAGPHALYVSAGDLPAGLYLVRFQTGAEQRTFPLVLAR